MRCRISLALLFTALAGWGCLSGCGQASGPAGSAGGKTGTGGVTTNSGGSPADGGSGTLATSTALAGNSGSGGAAAATAGSTHGSGGAAGAGTGGVGGRGGTAGSGGAGGGVSSGGSTATGPGAGGSSTAGATGARDGAAFDASQDVRKSDAWLGDVSDAYRAAGGAAGQPADGPGGVGGSGDASGDPNKKIKVWLAGDSTMMSCTGSCPCGWGSQFQPLLSSNATVVNSAVGGRSIQTWLYDPNVTTSMDATGECVVNPKTYSSRWQEMTNPSTGMKAGDYLLIQFGINDGDSTCNRHVGTALFQTYLGSMAEAAKKVGAQPVFLTSTSYIGCSGSTATTNRGFVSETKTAGKANDVPVIDLTALSAALYTSRSLCPNNADYTSTTSAVGKFFCEDHTHFEAAGASEIAKLVAKALQDQGIGLAAYLR